MPSDTLYNLLDFNIDRYLNPYIPRNHLYILPKPISHYLGYRHSPSKEPPAVIQWILTVLATVAGICVVGGVFNYAPAIQSWHPPSIFASLGASAVLDYNTIRSPLAQPRNSIIGHTLSAIVGTGIAKAFMLAPGFFANYDWIAAAIACAGATLAMSMASSIHPPGGATAILACTEKQIIGLGWMFPPLILLASTLMVSVACVFNNTLRQYPVFWWTPDEVGHKLPGSSRRKEMEELPNDVKEVEEESTDAESGHFNQANALENGHLNKVESNGESVNSGSTLQREFSHEIEFLDGLEALHVAPYMIRMPPDLGLSDAEVEALQRLMLKLRKHMETR